jgi:hypothetical protein
LQELLPETKPGSTTTNPKPREEARNGAIPHHQNPRSSGRSHLHERLCWLYFGMNEALSWNITRLGETPSPLRHIPICWGIIFGLQSHESDVDIWLQLSFCNMTMLEILRPVQQLQPSLTFTLILFHMLHTHHTSPQVITTCLDHSKMRWEDRNFVPMKRCTRRCTSGCAHDHKNFFPEKSVLFLCAGGSVLNVRETMSKNGTLVLHFCSINHM